MHGIYRGSLLSRSSELARALLLGGAVLFATACCPMSHPASADEVETEEVAAPATTVYVILEEPAPPAAPQPAPEDRWEPDPFPTPNPFARVRTWVGDYDCVQGRTGLAFRIIDVRGSVIRAIF